MEPEKGQKSTRKSEEGVRKRPNKGELLQGTLSSVGDYPISGQEDLLPQQQHFPSSLKIAREGPPRRVGRPCKPKVPLLEQLHVSKSQPVSPAFMAPRVDTEHGLDGPIWKVADPIQSGPSRSFSSSALHARLSRPAEDPTQKAHVQRPTQVSLKQVDEPHKKEKKPQKPGKYICQYCSRPCAKPSVLQKHIRSHTGERPYPCIPCGFSFKTKSNLYKHRKSHAHRIKAGLSSEIGVETYPSNLEMERLGGEDIDDPSEGESTDSEDETSTMSNLVELSPHQKHTLPTCDSQGVSRQQGTSHDLSLSQQNVSHTSEESVTFTDPSPELTRKSEDTHTIKQKLALRLSERKKASEEQTFLSPGSKGSTESGYFSRSESAEQQISPPNTNAKSYAEIILGKCGRIGQRPSILASPLLGTAEEKTSMAQMSVPRTQVIEHITKLITINEAVVDTSEIDSVKPRRSSLSRRSSIESPKAAMYREPFQFDVKSPGSISQLDSKILSEKTKAELSFTSIQQSHSATETVPLLRSHSMPSSACSISSPHPFRASYSFDDRIVDSEVLSHSHMFSSHPRLLKRQPAIELPLGMDYSSEEGSSTGKDTVGKTSDDLEGKESEMSRKSKKGSRGKGLIYECNICGARYKKRGNYETHKKYYCSELQILKPEALASHSSVETRKGYSEHETWSQVLNYKLGPSLELSTLRKRRKEKSLGDDEEPQSADWSDYPASGTPLESHFTSSSLTLSSDAVNQSVNRSESTSLTDVHTITLALESKEKTTISKEISVIQHTSSFEKSESMEKKSSFDEEDMTAAHMSSHTVRPHTQSSHPLQPKLVRQRNIQVPEILVTEEPDKPEVELEDPPKEQEKVEEFQWPQRSQSLAQLPAEKLPPKKKRLRLAEMAQSSGDSSFESMSLTRSPSQDSSLSHALSHSVSFDREEGCKLEISGQSSESTVKSFGHHMLTVPSHHHHAREMRRSASEQTPNVSRTSQVSENRSKSFDYGNLTSSASTSMPTAQERRKCFSLRQTSLSRHVELEPELMPREWKEPDQPSSSSHIPGMISHKQSSNISPKEQPGSNTRSIQSLTDETEKSYLSQQLSLFPVQPLLHLPQHTSELSFSQSIGNISAPFSLHPMTQSVFHTPIPLQSALLQPDDLQIPQHLTSHALDIPFRPHSQFLHLPYPVSSPLHPTFLLPMQHQFALPLSAQVGGQYPQIKPEISPPLARSSLSACKDYIPENIQTPTRSPLALEPAAQVTLAHSEPVVSVVVPVRIQTHMPSYGNAMYTTLSQMLVTQPHCSPSSLVIQNINDERLKGYHGFDLTHILPKHDSTICEIPFLRVPFPKTESSGYIPLTTSVESVLGFDGSSSSVGGSKRMLSPAGSLELTMETQQQKRVKEEEDPEVIVQEEMLKEQLMQEQSRSTNVALLVTRPQSRLELTPPPPAVLERLLVTERYKSQLATTTIGPSHPKSPEKNRQQDDTIKIKEEKDDQDLLATTPSNIPTSSRTSARFHVTVPHEETESKNVQTFPTLHTTTNVSWCYLNYVKPNHTQQTDRRASVYSSWCISLYNPNLPGVSTRVALSLLRSKQKTSSEIYTTANAPQADSSLLVPSQTRKPKMTETPLPAQARKETSKTGKEEEKRVKTEDSGPTVKRGEPSRLRIFEGGYKSNEEYVYVRGRGRGKYVCEECGIRCKKPSMLKKHIRTHTDHRPYVCKHCNFAFKTKGNLTKHMKSKAHSKKCQELGLVPPSLAELDAEEGTNDERWPECDVVEEHQFSDLEDTDDEEDSDEEEDEEEEEEDDDEEDESQEEKNPDPSPNILTPYLPTEPRQNLESADTPPVCQFSPRQLQTSEPPEKDPQALLVSEPSISQELIPRRRWSPGKDIGCSRAGPSRRHLLQKRETSPKYFSPTGCTSPRRGMSPCQRLPSAREVSPLRCVSPQHLSPHCNLSPRTYMSPERGSSPPVRHLSPNREVTSLRYGPFRGGLASPPRYPSPGREEQHLSRSDAQTHLKPKHGVFPSSALPQRGPEHLEKSGIKKQRPSAFPALSRSLCSPMMPHTLTRSGENLYTHLPLHSQHLQRTTYPMIPIGGIQMVQARPSPQPSLVGAMFSELHSESPDKEPPHQLHQGESEQPLRTNRREEEEDRVISPISTALQHSPTPSTYCQTACTPPGMPRASTGSLKGERVEGEG
ncbi:transcription factor HIVEP3 isoform X2 [Mixophyes fleayi]|uniref:transcription factor HIVEP3 isoform X2 n=1 Tax=Mixophyes fleayi TaxID=3061075 RepID=UPI003F4DF660